MKVRIWRIWNCRHDWITSRSIRDKSRVDYCCKEAMRGTLDASKRAVPHLIAHKIASTIAPAAASPAAKTRKRVDIAKSHLSLIQVVLM